MNILITGGAGFIGSHTTERMVEEGYSVRIVDDLSAGNLDNLAAIKNEVDVIQLDIRNFEPLSKACDGADVILHLAAVSSVEKSINDPLYSQEVNTTGTLNVLEAARQKEVRRLVMAGSAAIYGDHPELPKTERSPTQPQSPYAWQKLSGEFYGKTYADLYGLEFLSLRYFNVYGPRQDPSSPYSGVISIFTQMASQGKTLLIHGDGNQTRDFIYVSDVAEVNLSAMTAPAPLPEAVNVSTGLETSIVDLAELIRDLGSSGSRIEYGEPRRGDIDRSCASNELMIKTFGRRPEITVEEGIRRLLDSSSES